MLRECTQCVPSLFSTDLISHSMSREEIKFIFSDLLPDLTGKTVVDIGSRLGAVLYGVCTYCGPSRFIITHISRT